MRRVTRVRPAAAGLTLVETLVVVWVFAILSAVAVPQVLSGLDDLRTRAAARYLSSQFSHARLEAVKRSRRVGFRFEWDGAEYRFGMFVDGNSNGVRTADIALGIDPRLTPDGRLSAFVSKVNFGIGAEVPLIDGGLSTDPIRVAGGRLVTFGPDGTASTGSVYIRGARGAQYAVRVFGVTGRSRTFRYIGGTWKPL